MGKIYQFRKEIQDKIHKRSFCDEVTHPIGQPVRHNIFEEVANNIRGNIITSKLFI